MKIRIVVTTLFLALTTLSLAWSTPLEARLRLLLDHPPAVGKSDGEIIILVQATDGGTELRAWLSSVGGAFDSRHGDVFVCRVGLDRLRGIETVKTVTWVEASRPLHSEMDVARGPIGTNLDAFLAARAAAKQPALTGKGVIVGVIDSGFDTTVPMFKTADGKTRILYFWDQRYSGSGGVQPTVTLPDGTKTTFTTGREFTAADIDAARYVNRDPGNHGTGVAHCAAGADARFPGMAPEADLMFCVNIGDDFRRMLGTGETLNAYTWLMARARQLKRPLVVNQSQGTQFGPHDGTSLFDQALQADITRQNLIVCVASGNEGDEPWHARTTTAAEATDIVDLRLNDTGAEEDIDFENSVDIWCDATHTPTLQITRYTDATYTTAKGATAIIGGTAQGTFAGHDGDNNTTFNATLKKDLPYTFQSRPLRNHTLLVIHTADQSVQNFYRIQIGNDSATSLTTDYYIQGYDSRGDIEASGFLTHVTRLGSITTPGTTPGAITVGAYVNRNEVPDNSGLPARTPGTLAEFSSVGPLDNTAGLYTGLDAIKPDITAPGERVVTARSTGATGRGTLVDNGRFNAQNGTSFASPIVAGEVALFLQENPAAKPADVKTWLEQKARRDAFTGPNPNSDYGWGKADVLASFTLVVSPKPQLEKAVRETPTRVRLSGSDFARSSHVAINGVTVPDEQVEWEDDDDIVVTVKADTVIEKVTVHNDLAPAGEADDTLTLSDPTPPAALAQLTTGGGSGGSGGGCFIATAAYGSYLDPHVMALRQFRDRWLLTNAPGRWFVAAYYRLSPPLADVIRQYAALRLVTRVLLTPLVLTVEHPLAVLVLGVLSAMAWRRRRRGGMA